MAAGFGEQIAYDALARKILKVELDKSSRFTDWARRPLSEAQLTYALADVTHLAELYPILRERLEKAGRLSWVTEEMAAMCDPALYDVDPENAWRRLRPRKHAVKYLAVFRAVAAWRERTAQQLWPIARAGKAFRHRPQPVQAVGAVVELLKVLLKARAEDAGVASKLIATVADLEKIASDDHAEAPALHGWRREAFGEDALKLKRGELALVLDGTRVRVVPVRRAAKV
jgi:ribonuclease D